MWSPWSGRMSAAQFLHGTRAAARAQHDVYYRRFCQLLARVPRPTCVASVVSVGHSKMGRGRQLYDVKKWLYSFERGL